MNCVQVVFQGVPLQKHDILIAKLATLDLNGIEEEGATIKAYFDKLGFPHDAMKIISDEIQLTYKIEEIEETNWNEEWERNFQPLVIDDFCSVRAHFHPQPEDLAVDIIITPKMSFGTGHHATTELMITAMRQIDFEKKSVFDFGTGTGILAILAKKLGAARVFAIDNDKWSIENARENFEFNKVDDIELSSLALDTVCDETFDIVLANINRSVLLDSMSSLRKMAKESAYLLLSGILEGDINIIQSAAERVGFHLEGLRSRNGWSALLFKYNTV